MAMDHDTIVGELMRNRAKLYAYIWTIVSDAHVAEDVLQEVSMLAIKKADSINDKDHLMLWSRQTARNIARNTLRKESRQPRALGDDMAAIMDGHFAKYDEVSSSEMVEALHSCMRQLTPRARRIVKLRYDDGLSGQQLAAALQNGVRSVYTTISRIHRALGDCIRSKLSFGGRDG